jgi:hypothetical protein
MTAHFSVVQYVPDAVADERINIGVIAVGDGGIRCRFLRDWERVERFGGRNVAFLKDFARSVQETVVDQNRLLPVAPPLNLNILEHMATGWINSIQLTPPRGSIQDSDTLLASVAGDFLKERVPTKRETRQKRSIAVDAQAVLSDALEQRCGTSLARELVTRDYRYRGKHDEHEFDVAVGNGEVFLGAYALSFQIADTDYLHDRVKITGWDLSDVRSVDTELGLAVIASLPVPGHRHYDTVRSLYLQTEQICKEYEVSLVPEDNLFQIAAEIAERIPESAIPKG